MTKKRIYMIIFAVVIVLGYLNYFKEEDDISNLKKTVETTNVTYESDDYHVEAEKQVDYLDENETDFEKAKALVKDMVISGDNVFIDKVRNLALKNNILGVSQNGWKFSAQTANYEKVKDEVTSNTGVSAFNEEKKIKISGTNFVTDSKMSFIELRDNVVLENDRIKLKGDVGKYSDSAKLVTLSGNIKVDGKDERDQEVDGNFLNLKYDVDKKVLEAWEPFDITYGGVKVSGENLWYQDESEALLITKNVMIETNGYKIYVDKIQKEAGSNIVKFFGKVTGSNGEYSFEGAEGIYNIESEELSLIGDVKVTSTKGEELIADRIVYSDKTKFITAYGGKKDAIYLSNNGELRSKDFKYNNETKEIFVDSRYTFKSQKYDSVGEKLYYNNETKDGYVINGTMVDKIKKQSAKGKRLDFNSDTKVYKIDENAIFENLEYRLESSQLVYDGGAGKIETPANYKVTNLKNGIVFTGKGANYDENSGELLSTGIIDVLGENFKAKGKNLTYNNKTGAGELESEIYFKNTENGTIVTGDKLLFQKDSSVELVGNLVITSEKIVAKSTRGKYNLKEEKVYIPEVIAFESLDKKTSGTMSKGVYDVKKEIFAGDNFKGKNVDSDITSSVMKYFTLEDRVEFGKNTVIVTPDGTLKGNRLDYNLVTEVAKSLEPYTALYGDFTIKGKKGNFDSKNGAFESISADIVSKNGDHFSANRAEGNLQEMRVDFIGDAKGHTNYDNKRTDFSGDFARVYFKDENGYKAIRSEVKNNAVFIQDEKTLKSNYIEADLERDLIFARDNTKMIIKDVKNGDTVITSDIAEVNMNNDTATLIGNVYIENVNEEQGKTVVTADKGIARQKSGILDLIGNVKIENSESVVEADEATYNTNSKKIKARGHVYINHKNQ